MSAAGMGALIKNGGARVDYGSGMPEPVDARPVDMFQRYYTYKSNDRYRQGEPLFRDDMPGAPRPDAYAGVYHTSLSDTEEIDFRKWVEKNGVPFDPNDRSPDNDYDMRGFWRDMMKGRSTASSGTSEYDGKIHYSDYYKTPYHASFSQESQWARPGMAPQWIDDKLVDRKGNVIVDETPRIKTDVNRSK